MTNAEVIQALEEYVKLNRRVAKLFQQDYDLIRKIEYYKTQKEKPTPKRPSFIGIMLTSLIIAVLTTIIPTLFIVRGIYDITFEYFEQYVDALFEMNYIHLLLCIWIILSVVVACIVTFKRYKKKKGEACAEYVTEMMKYNEWKEGKKQLPSLESKQRMVMAEWKLGLNNLNQAKLKKILHPDYIKHAETILDYFQRGRVRDLRDAINLLEQELREESRDKATEAYRKEMKQQAYAQRKAAEEAAEQSRRAAAAAEEAAFWGSAATFVAATNSKKSDNGDYHVV